MKIIGLTGGIGSGKSTVAKLFHKKGVPIYTSDERAKYLMVHSLKLKTSIQNLLGVDAYFENGNLNRKYISDKIFQDQSLLQKMNALVHPIVFEDSEKLKMEHKSLPFGIKESAILFESGAYLLCDIVISVITDENTRIQRTISRDNLEEKEIKKRMKNQWSDQQRIEKSDFMIFNNHSIEDLNIQVDKIYDEMIKMYLT